MDLMANMEEMGHLVGLVLMEREEEMPQMAVMSSLT